ncbi:ornithine--oxo-acid transaminase [Salsuginibacillus halophilus]|uniref:Ornithine aminotransferase n=1 Tax=Salsuginibacillus halophilus TaxID=517424 RepID=A0A2P8H812_9BACI|nr:ornithine--oxo-acid transaminase [Salsuginibacillus halophilus]PSL42329.1 ornithine--oxo-acid transaminase [Salsuginibacillus halophilus]
MTRSEQLMKTHDAYGAPNYKPLPVVISHGDGAWVTDVEGNQYLDMLSAYSAVNQGHRHPRIIQALTEQAGRLTLTSRAFHNDQISPFYEKVAELTGKAKVLPMNTGAEAVETAVKAARRWAYWHKGVEAGKAEIIACEDNFHGRTMSAVSLSSNEEYQKGFEPLLPGIKIVPYGDVEALKAAITPNTAAFLFEPIQGEAGINIPPEGFLRKAKEVCEENNVLYIADEIQSGLGRSGKPFACDWEDVTPDMYILGKALGGGVMPISVLAADEEVMNVFQPGSHGSTFGGNPLACAVSLEALQVLEDEALWDRSRNLGDWVMEELQSVTHPRIQEVRGRGLFIGIELSEAARPFCEALQARGILCKETHDNVLRLAPPLIISEKDLRFAIDEIKDVLSA